MLKKYVPNNDHIIEYTPLVLGKNLTYEEVPTKIVDNKEQVLRRRIIKYVKV